MASSTSPGILDQEIAEIVIKEASVRALILYNDDFNTFQFVTESLIKVCHHDALQAEQSTYLVHNAGK
jgi:ATP-dependent Clp protease adaptor protein ClpS